MMAVTRAQWNRLQASLPPNERESYETYLSYQTSGSSQVFPGDFGDGGAVGERITPAPKVKLSDLEKESADATTAIESAMATGDAAAAAGDAALDQARPVVTDTIEDLLARQEADRIAEADRRDRQSAYDILYNEFSNYGLSGLVEDVRYLLESNVSPSQFSLELKNRPAYQNRFAANKERIAKGLRALSPAEYIDLEDQYQNVMRNYGLPASYYTKDTTGKQAGFEKFLAGDVSSAELENRIVTAQDRVINASPQISQALKQFYPDITNGDILAYTLDPRNAIKEIQRKVTTAEIGGAALQAGLQTGVNRADVLRAAGVTKESAEQGFGTIAGGLQRGSQLASIYGEDPYTQATAETEVFRLSGQQEARKQRQKITGLEKATFGGQTGITSGALARDRAGGY
jgi:hypothetical protein